uniref:Flavone synthase II n=1 Tax=Kalanchoe fedtschenkoi TaxID=63787 RepID=A0A7N0UAF2_KALFE
MTACNAMFAVPSLPVVTLTAISILVISIIILRNKSHRRRRPPGPWGLPLIGHLHLIGPVVHRAFQSLSARYGPIVHLRFGSVPVVLVSSPDLAREFLKSHEITFSSRKHSLAIARLSYNSPFAFAPYGPYWKFIKRISTVDLLGTRSIGKFLPIRRREVHRFLKVMKERADEAAPVNLTEEFLKLAYNIISQMMIGARPSDTQGQAEEVRTLVREVTKIHGQFFISDYVNILKGVDVNGIKERVERVFQRYDGLLEKIISEREGERRRRSCGADETGEDAAKDFLDILLDVMDDEHAEMKLTRNHIKALILDYFTAATDTSAIVMEWALAELINSPTIMQAGRDEIDRAVGKHRIVEETDVPNLPYLLAVMKENLRLHPPIPVVARRSTKEVTVAGYTIQEGSLLFVNNWGISRNPEYWDRPLEFRPSRFLEADGPDVKGQHFHVLPFGSGRRGCPGMSLAMMELPMVLAAMVQCFEWKLVAGSSGVNMVDGKLRLDMTEQPGLTVPRAHELVCVPVARR